MIANSFKQDIIQTYNDIGVINDEFNKVNVGLRLLKKVSRPYGHLGKPS